MRHFHAPWRIWYLKTPRKIWKSPRGSREGMQCKCMDFFTRCKPSLFLVLICPSSVFLHKCVILCKHNYTTFHINKSAINGLSSYIILYLSHLYLIHIHISYFLQIYHAFILFLVNSETVYNPKIKLLLQIQI